MELKELTEEERLALVALIELLTEAVPEISDEQVGSINAVVDAVGERAYAAAADEVDQRFEDTDALREFLSTIDRREAQNLIYATVLEVAMVNSVDPREGELLDWLADAWKISTRIQEPT